MACSPLHVIHQAVKCLFERGEQILVVPWSPTNKPCTMIKICGVSIIRLQASVVVCVGHCGIKYAQLHSGLRVFTCTVTLLALRRGWAELQISHSL